MSKTEKKFVQTELQFQTNWNARYTKKRGERFTKASKTVPDDSLSIPELIRNHTRGVPSKNAQEKQPIYLGDDHGLPSLEEFANMDNIDRQDTLHALKSEINAIQTEHQHKLKNSKKDTPQPPKEVDKKADQGDRSGGDPKEKRSESKGEL